MSDLGRLIAILLIILGNAFFVAAEYALVTCRRPRLQELAGQGNRRAALALKITDEPVRFISTIQLGVTVFSILLGAVGQPLLVHLLDPVLATSLAFLLAFALVTYLHIILGELVPKGIALARREETALLLAVPLEAFYILSAPLVAFLRASAGAILRSFRMAPALPGVIVASEEELRMIVAAAEEKGIIEEAEEEMLYKVFDFADTEAFEVMIPRHETVALPIGASTREWLATVVDIPHTRYPVYRGSLDQIAGILNVHDVVPVLYKEGIEGVRLERLLRPAFLVPERKNLGALLADFRRTRQQMAIVVDEYGTTTGIVTLEDLLEEIVGEIASEYELPDESVRRLGERTALVDGAFPLDDFNEQFAQALPLGEYHTLAGFVFGLLGRAPVQGDEVAWGGLRFRVAKVKGLRIAELVVDLPPAMSSQPPSPLAR